MRHDRCVMVSSGLLYMPLSMDLREICACWWRFCISGSVLLFCEMVVPRCVWENTVLSVLGPCCV